MDAWHTPVMLQEVLELLDLKEGGSYLDATVGLGGHALEILSRIGPHGTLIGMDRDEEALKQAALRIKDERFKMEKAKFSQIKEKLGELDIDKLDGVLFDFGVSMMQLKEPGRGFSFTSEEPLDMRMDATDNTTAQDIVNNYTEKELERVIREYGEEWRSRRIARAIVTRRRKGKIRTCRELGDLVYSTVGRTGRAHPATKTFQGIRIEVNDELNEIRHGLENSLGVLARGGRLVAISYHSLEDRAVKVFMRETARSGAIKVLTKKPLRPSREETFLNPSARSARLRAGEV